MTADRLGKQRLKFPDEPIHGRSKHAHHFDGSHGCEGHFRTVQPHQPECFHAHAGVGHLIDVGAECGFRYDENGKITAMSFGTSRDGKPIVVGIG